MYTNARNRTPRPQKLKPRLQRRAMPNNLNHDISAPPIRQLHHARREALPSLQIIPRLGPDTPRALEARVNPVDSENSLWRILERRDERAEAHGSAPDQHDDAVAHFLGIQVRQRVRRRKVPRRQDVRHQTELPLFDARGRLDHRRVRQRHPHVLGLPAVEQGAAEEQARRAPRGEPALAVEARPAAYRERADDGVAGPHGCDGRAGRVDCPCELVPHDEARCGGLVASVYVQFAGRALVSELFPLLLENLTMRWIS